MPGPGRGRGSLGSGPCNGGGGGIIGSGRGASAPSGGGRRSLFFDPLGLPRGRLVEEEELEAVVVIVVALPLFRLEVFGGILAKMLDVPELGESAFALL